MVENVAKKEMKSKKIYLIINFRNSSKSIRKCFLSLINQKYKNIFFVLFDHSSSDNSKQILIDLIKKYNIKNFKFLGGSSNRSLVQCRNLAVKFVLSKAKPDDFLAFCDSDDWWHPMWLKSLILKTAAKIAASVADLNKSELMLVARLSIEFKK